MVRIVRKMNTSTKQVYAESEDATVFGEYVPGIFMNRSLFSFAIPKVNGLKCSAHSKLYAMHMHIPYSMKSFY